MKESRLKRERSISLVVFTMILAFTASCADPENNPVSTDSGSNPPPDYISGPRIFGHSSATLEGLSEADVALAKNTLHIGYAHTSHGSQLTDGLDGLDAFTGGTGLYAMQRNENEGSLHLSDTFMENDVGYYPDRVTETRDFLGTPNDDGRGAAHPAAWYQCDSAHSEPLNANRKAYAAWRLFAALAKTL